MRITNLLRSWQFAALLGVAALPVASCSSEKILSVTDPDVVDPTAVRSAAGAAALFAGAVGEFNFALTGNNGGQEGLILVGGLMSDEYYHSGTFPTRLEYEVRAIDEKNTTLLPVFRQAQRARELARATIPLLREFRPTDVNLTTQVGEMFYEQAMMYTFIGEMYCNGVPFSRIFPAVEYGPVLTTPEIFTEAVALFDSALAQLGTRTDTAGVLRFNAAKIGKGRALLNRASGAAVADFTAAAAAVAGVPATVSFRSTHSTATGRNQNGVMVFNWTSERWSVADVEGITGLNYRSAGDGRITVTSGGVGFDGTSPQWNLNKYNTNVTPHPLSQGVEAKLIIAEALLKQGNVAAWLDTLNFLRGIAPTIQTGVAALPALADPGPSGSATNPDSLRHNLMFRERAFWLFGTGHRMGDLRRLQRQYGRTEDGTWPTGRHFKNTTDYGNDVNLPVPYVERNNPNFNGCIDRNP